MVRTISLLSVLHPGTEGSTVRTVLSAGGRIGDEWTFDIQADAFLYRMVRRLVFVQVAVGQGRLPAETLVRALEDSPGSRREDLG